MGPHPEPFFFLGLLYLKSGAASAAAAGIDAKALRAFFLAQDTLEARGRPRLCEAWEAMNIRGTTNNWGLK